MSTDADPQVTPTIYEVGSILSDRVKGGVQQFKIRWLGFDSDEDSWEPLKNLAGCPEMVRKYSEDKVSKSSRSRSRGRPPGRPPGKKFGGSPAKSKSTSRGRVSARSTSRSRARSKSANKASQSKKTSKSPARAAKKTSPVRLTPPKARVPSPRRSLLPSTPPKTDNDTVTNLMRFRPGHDIIDGVSNAGVTPRRSSLYSLRSYESNGGSEIKRPPTPVYRRPRRKMGALTLPRLGLALLVGLIVAIISTLAYYQKIPINHFNAWIKKFNK